MRIIGGRWKRTPLAVADVDGLRPTPDRVRETVFNWIAHLRPDLAACRGLDLYAGTGALGFELASRGAAAVTLVERHPAALAALRSIRERLQAASVDIVGGDALAVARTLPTAAFDVVFVDPPYRHDAWRPALQAVRPLLRAAALVYVEDDAPLAPDALASLGYDTVRVDRAGQVNFALLAPTQA